MNMKTIIPSVVIKLIKAIQAYIGINKGAQLFALPAFWVCL